MPSLPKFGNRLGNIGIIKVFQKTETKHPPQTDSHVRVTGKVKIQLNGISDNSQPGITETKRFRLLGKNTVNHDGQRIGDQNLFGQTDDKTLQTDNNVGKGNRTLVNLFADVVILDNRSRHQLRKQYDIQSQLVNVFLRLNLAAVNVYQIRNGLKGIKRNAYRHNHVNKIKVKLQRGINVIDNKVKILEINQKTQIDQNRQCQRPFSSGRFHITVNQPGSGIGNENRHNHNCQITRLAPGVKNDAGRQQNIIADFLFRKQVNAHNQRHKHKNKRHRTKKHCFFPYCCSGISSFIRRLRKRSPVSTTRISGAKASMSSAI